MVKLEIRNGDLIVEDDSNEIFNWQNRAFFNISLEFEVDEENHRYFFTEKNKFQDSIREIVSYLKENEVEFIPDEQVAQLISNIKQQEAEFSQVKENLNTKISLQKSTSFQRELKPYQAKGVEHFLKIKHGANFSSSRKRKDNNGLRLL
jgi:hypothetical protein